MKLVLIKGHHFEDMREDRSVQHPITDDNLKEVFKGKLVKKENGEPINQHTIHARAFLYPRDDKKSQYIYIVVCDNHIATMVTVFDYIKHKWKEL